MLIYAAGSGALAFPLSWTDNLYSWSPWRTIVPLVFGLTLLIFGHYQNMPSEAILTDRNFRNRTAVPSFATGGMLGLILYTSLQYLPLYHGRTFSRHPFRQPSWHFWLPALSSASAPSCQSLPIPRDIWAGLAVHRHLHGDVVLGRP